MRYYIIAGEASGDLHGSNLVRSILEEDSTAEIRAWGGDLMQSSGAEIVKHYRDLAFMGFWEVLKNIWTILANFRFAKREIAEWRPDVLILIDFPGFNLRMAKWASKRGIRVFYYISPQIWAWHTSRVHRIKKDVERMYVILPFEKEFYGKHNFEVEYVGHPLLDVTEQIEVPEDFRKVHELDDRPIIAMLPGSRKQEIEAMLPRMAAMVEKFPAYQFVVAGAPALKGEYYHSLLQKLQAPANQLKIVSGSTYLLLKCARAALVTSGTATLETALLGTPQVVCYKSSALSYWLARRLVRVSFISLVNLIVEAPLVRELIQGNLNDQELELALEDALSESGRSRILEGYKTLRTKIGTPGASARAGQLMVRRLRGG